jgi:choline kinase
MNAIILAAGRGSRLGEMTANRPKALTKLAGKPLIEWQIRALNQAGINNISLVAGYHAEAFEDYNLPTFINENWANTNMVASLLCTDSILSTQDSIISYSDIIYHSSIIKQLIDNQADFSITYDLDWLELWKLRFSQPLIDAESFKHNNGHLLEIGKKVTDLNEINGQYMGLIKISAQSWAKIRTYLLSLSTSELAAKDMTTLLQELISLGHSIATIAINGKWVEVDNLSDLACYQAKLGSNLSWKHDWR